MDGSFLSLLQGISPGWWVALAALLLVVEMMTASAFLLGPGLAALCIALWLWLQPGLSGAGQLIGFAALAVLLTVLLRALLRRRTGPEVAEPGLNRRGQQMVGRQARILRAEAGGVAEVEVDRMRWQARFSGPPPAAGSEVRVLAAEGIILVLDSPRS